MVGVVDKPKILGPEQEGDTILGLPSWHSLNGYSLVRKVAIEGKTVEELNQPFWRLDGESLADAVLRPTTFMRVDCCSSSCRRTYQGYGTSPVAASLRTLIAPYHLTLMQRLIVVGSYPAWSIPPVIISYVSNAALCP